MTIVESEFPPHFALSRCEESLPKLVQARAAERPHAVAVVAGAQILTYGELDRRANRLANYLRAAGVSRDVTVGLCVPRSLDMVVGALGIWKAGGAYLPMDPAHPADRLACMLDDAQAPVVIARSCLAPQLSSPMRKALDPGAPALDQHSVEPPPLEIMPGDLAYVIYTSGSTGVPKGVDVAHGALANLSSWHRQVFSVTAADRASHIAGLSFDAAVWELWPYLAAGASIHLANDITRNSAELLRDWLLSSEITIGFVPTPMAERMLALSWPRNTPLRTMLTGGDTLRHYPPPTLPFELVNNYGPTECSVVATSGVVPPDTGAARILPSIGRPIANTDVHILDEYLDPVPVGASGEIHIGGAGVARGYHNRPDLTAEKFIADPFNPGRRLYKTGDIGRVLPGGQIAFVCRADEQIKIRGYRIEPDEIASALNRYPQVRQSLIVARSDLAGDKCLVAYLTLERGSTATHSGLRDFLRTLLPEYMIPAVFVRLNEFPLTPHGKIDRVALPEPCASNTLQDEVAEVPRTDTERRVSAILEELLGLKEIEREGNFFLLGGHSLLGAQLIVRIQNTFGVGVSLQKLFEAPTVAALSVEVERLSRPGQRS